MKKILSSPLPRRRFVTGAAAGAALLGLSPGSVFARSPQALTGSVPELRGQRFDLHIGYQAVNITGRDAQATVVNGSLPAPTLRWKEGERVQLRVHNHLAVDSSIHWHGLILPSNMDGVPGMSFAGIKPGSYYDYAFDVQQSGTYWYHSHSGFQEQTGVYGAIVIDPAEPDPVHADREHVVVLSDWTDQVPEALYARLKKQSHYYNRRERTVGDLWQDLRENGLSATWQDRAMWNRMRMSDSDIADINGLAYTFLVNGHSPDDNWRALFKAGETVRLRIINAAAMTLFDLRIPGLEMTVVAADGQNVEPVTVDEFRIAPAETYDILVRPSADRAYTLFAQSIDRSGYACATLSPNSEWQAEIPAMDHAPRLHHRDMGMDHSAMAMAGAAHAGHTPNPATPPGDMDHGSMNHGKMDQRDMSRDRDSHAGHRPPAEMDHRHHGMHSRTVPSDAPIAPAGAGSRAVISHPASENNPGVDMQAQMPTNGLDDPGIGLREHAQRYGRRVLRYSQLFNLGKTLDRRDPERELAIHLTGNMSRYMWSMDGVTFDDAEPILLRFGERLRIVLINDTMMTHPIHLHGLWSELETGEPLRIPRKHTIIVQPGSKISYLVSADAVGRWAYHCHLSFHMPGMFREVRVIGGAA